MLGLGASLWWTVAYHTPALAGTLFAVRQALGTEYVSTDVTSDEGRPPMRERSVDEDENDRAKLIDSALDPVTRQSYEATMVRQIAAAAGLTPRDFAGLVPTEDAVILSIIVPTRQAAVADVPPQTSPAEAPFIAHAAVRPGMSVIEHQRLLALSPVIHASTDLLEQAGSFRKNVMTTDA